MKRGCAGLLESLDLRASSEDASFLLEVTGGWGTLVRLGTEAWWQTLRTAGPGSGAL